MQHGTEFASLFLGEIEILELRVTGFFPAPPRAYFLRPVGEQRKRQGIGMDDPEDNLFRDEPCLAVLNPVL